MRLSSACALLTAFALMIASVDARAFGGGFTLMEPDGQSFSLEQARGKVVLLSFGYTFCPDVCPMTLSTLASALHGLTESELDKVVPLFITVDPRRDTPQRLQDYVSHFHAKIVGLTGSIDEISRVVQSYRGRLAYKGDTESDGYYISHPSSIYILGYDHSVHSAVLVGTPAELIVENIRRLLGKR